MIGSVLDDIRAYRQAVRARCARERAAAARRDDPWFIRGMLRRRGSPSSIPNRKPAHLRALERG